MASTNIGMGSCCLSGHLNNSATPSGREDTIGGLSTYVADAKETGSGGKAPAIVIITDIFGWKLPNVRLLADNYAKAGLTVYIPDFHQGDSLPIEFLQSVEPPLKVQQDAGLLAKAKGTFDVMATLGPWLAKHREGVAEPLISGFVQTLRTTPGTQKIGALGFCWGGRYAILQAAGKQEGKAGGVDAAFACHPSLLSIPADIDPVSVPLGLAVGSKDSLLDMKSVDQIKEILAKKSVPTEVQAYEDQIHGFALRGDWSSDKDRESMDAAEKQGIEFFKKNLA